MTDKKQPLADYRAKAEECLRMAEAAQSPEHRDSWLRLAASWFRMVPRELPTLPAAPASADPDETDPPESR